MNSDYNIKKCSPDVIEYYSGYENK